MLDELKAQEAAKEEEKMEKQRKRLEREEQKHWKVKEGRSRGKEKRKAKELEIQQKKVEREEQRRVKELETEMKKELKKREQSNRERKQRPKRGNVGDTNGRKLEDALQDLTIHSDSLEDEDRAICPTCSLVYPDDGGFWIGCDGCNNWFDLKCTDVKDEEHVPDTYYCLNCCVDFVDFVSFLLLSNARKCVHVCNLCID